LGLTAFFLLGLLQLRQRRFDFFLRRISTEPFGKLRLDPFSYTSFFSSHRLYSLFGSFAI